VILAAAFVLFARGLDYERLRIGLRQFDVHMLWVLFFLALAGTSLALVRYYILIRPVAGRIAFSRVARISLIALVMNYASPGKVGAPAKSVLLKGAYGIGLIDSAPSIIAEQLLDVTSLVLWLAASLVLFRDSSEVISFKILIKGQIERLAFGVPRMYVVLTIFSIFLGIVLVGVLARRQAISGLRRFGSRWKELTWGRHFLYPVCATALIHHTYFLLAYLSFRALKLRIGYTFTMFLISASVLAGYLSPLPGGAGVREAFIAGMYNVVYGNVEMALVVSVLLRVLFFLTIPFLYLLLFVRARWKHDVGTP